MFYCLDIIKHIHKHMACLLCFGNVVGTLVLVCWCAKRICLARNVICVINQAKIIDEVIRVESN